TELIHRCREASLLASCADLLSWDEETYMPARGAEHRSRQRALLAGMVHDRLTDPRIGELLDAVVGSSLVSDPHSPAAVNVRELRRDFERERRVPRSLVEELARVTTIAQQEWVSARRDADFARFQPWLERIVELKKSEAEAVGYHEVAYDALLDDYEPGVTSRDYERLFAALREELVPLVDAIAGAERRPDRSLLRRDYPIERQRQLCERISTLVGFDFEQGRLDTSAHPFSAHIGPGDCRITTRYRAEDFSDALLSTMHEVGHGLYDQGLDPQHAGTPAGASGPMGLHESQSRLWENRMGRSLGFWTHLFPIARELFADALRDVSSDELFFAANDVRRSAIRVEADEVTYNLHPLIRFELERDLMSGALRVAELPEAWNELYRRHLGLTPPNVADGCLQDSHWSGGLIGYFPAYSLGDVCSAQLFAQAERELGDLDAAFERGEFRPLLDWMRDRVHRHGRRYTAATVVQEVTGTGPDPRPLVGMLREKYETLYGIAARYKGSRNAAQAGSTVAAG
ncbi:MAG TPA: carboxypeptidase M32, partial [Gemmatimonadaceae bacterium]|nr:carboxypeptidase M32 [Gemmatimonadaceae bacterium]